MPRTPGSANQVEFINATGGSPVVIGAGSFEEVAEAIQEGRVIDAGSPHPHDEGVSSGTRHTMSKLSTGLGPDAQASLEDYDARIREAKQGQVEKLRRQGIE